METQTFFRIELSIIHFSKGWTHFLITDGGGEYGGKEFEAKLKADGVSHQTTTPDMSESNSIAERIRSCLPILSLNQDIATIAYVYNTMKFNERLSLAYRALYDDVFMIMTRQCLWGVIIRLSLCFH